MKARLSIFVLLVAALVVCVDQATKTLALIALSDGPFHLIGPFNFTLVFNDGVAFGMASGIAPLLVILAICAVVVVLIKTRTQLGPWSLAACGLVLGGAAGNLADRLFRNHGGSVVDFIDIWRWPVFNIADVAVVVGAFSLAFAGARKNDGSINDDEQDVPVGRLDK